VNLLFKIVLYQDGIQGTLYTIQLENKNKTEFEKFLTNSIINKTGDFQELVAQLMDMLNRHGFQERFFKEKESSPLDAVVAFPKRGNIRLYCCYYSRHVLIAGLGGLKTTLTYQEDPELHRCIMLMAEVSRRIDQRIREKELWIDGNRFCGNLIFEEE